MKKLFFGKIFLVIFLSLSFFYFLFSIFHLKEIFAFNPPTQNPPGGGSAIGIATSTPANTI